MLSWLRPGLQRDRQVGCIRLAPAGFGCVPSRQGGRETRVPVGDLPEARGGGKLAPHPSQLNVDTHAARTATRCTSRAAHHLACALYAAGRRVGHSTLPAAYEVNR